MDLMILYEVVLILLLSQFICLSLIEIPVCDGDSKVSFCVDSIYELLVLYSLKHYGPNSRYIYDLAEHWLCCP